MATFKRRNVKQGIWKNYEAYFVNSYKELLPSNIANKSGLEKKIVKEYMKHQGLSSLDAKHLYTKTARELPTYGVTFFVVKEKQQKGKKKLVPRLLGISANAILRLDEETKEILQSWPLTQVMSYQVGKSHTFTLNFGDYSDKEYSVKTNDAVRIRDILQGYIDIIAKRLAGARNDTMNDGQVVIEDNVHSSRANIVQHVQNNPSKIVEESFVGPTKIVSYEPGQTAPGPQLVSVQQVLVSQQLAAQRCTITGDVPHRKGMSLEFVRKLNRMNSNSVKVVNLISSGDGPHTAELKSIVNSMESDMPLIASGVNAVAKTDMDEDAKKRLLNELQELTEFLSTLSQQVQGSNPDSDEALEAASKIADVSTQMYLGLDPVTKRRSNLIRLSRQSFIEDDKVDASLRRASFLSATAGACAAVDKAIATVNQPYEGAPLSPSEVEALEQTARDNMRKLNGAVALFLTAHADLENIDYSAAVTSMNTINELMVELAKDTQALANSKDEASKQELIADINKLCEATKLVCFLPGCGDHQKLQDVTSAYGPVADKLIFTFGRGRRDDKDNRIIDLARDVGEKTSTLLLKANELTSLVPAPQAEQLDEAGVQCAAAASGLLACAMLTSPCIHEPHCQSALTASAETLASSAQKVLLVAKPVLEDEAMKTHGDELKARSLELARALDALKNAYGNDNTSVDDIATKDSPRLKFMMRLADAKREIDEAEEELNKAVSAGKAAPAPLIAAMLEKTLALKMAEYNAAVASLLVATCDTDHPDFATAEAAIVTIHETLPAIVKDTTSLAASKDEATKAVMLEDVRKLCEATRGVCTGAGSGEIAELNQSAATLANTSNKLYFTFNPAAPTDKEKQILDMATAACTKTSVMLSDVYQLAEQAGASGELLDSAGARAAERAKTLITCAQLTGWSASCQSSLLRAEAALTSSLSELSQRCSKLYSPLVDSILQQQKDVQRELDKLRQACGGNKKHERSIEEERRRLQFVKSAAAAKAGLLAVEKELNKPISGPIKDKLMLTRQQQLSDAMARLSSAIATLTTATADPDNPDYPAAEEAMATITELMTLVVMDTKAMASSKDDKTREAMMADLRVLCDATRGICEAHDDPHQLRESAKKFGVASGKLVYILNPRTKPDDANKVIKHANQVCNTARQLLKDCHKLSDTLYSTDVAASELRRAAAKTADDVDALLTATQLTAPSLRDSRCQAVLLSSLGALSQSAQQLAQQWAPIQAVDKQPLVKNLDAQHGELVQRLDDMKRECLRDYVACPVRTTESKPETTEQKRVRFADTVSTTKSDLKDVEEELSQPYTSTLPKGQALAFRQLQLSNGLARLNAALAALAVATTDRQNPDYAAADEAMSIIHETLPQVVKDTKAMAAVRDAAAGEVMLGNARALCLATEQICDQAERDPKALRQFAKNFATASGKLIYGVNSRAKQSTAVQVMQSTQAACKTASQLVKTSCRLGSQLAPADAVRRQIADSGGRTADAADALMTAAQLTSPCISDPHCQTSFSTSIDTLSSSAKELSSHWLPLLQEPLLTAVIRELEKESQQLTQELDHLKDFCQDSKKGANDAKADELKTKETQKKQYISKAAAAKEAMMIAEKELEKPAMGCPAKGEAASAQQLQLSQQLAKLHAALLALSVATSDNNNPDFVTAGKSIDTISEMMPHVLRNTNTFLAGRESVTAENVADLRDLLRGLQEICGSVEQQDSAKLNDLLTKSVIPRLGKLYYVVHPKVGAVKVGKVEALAGRAGAAASEVLTGVFQLAAAAGPAAAQLEQQAAGTADAALTLLAAQQLTGPYIHEPEAQSTLISVADALSSSANNLAAVWMPIIQDAKHKAVGDKLTKDLGELEEVLENFRRACREPEPEIIVQKSISKPKPPPRKPSDEEVRQKQFTAALEKVASGVRAAEEDIKRVYDSPLDAPKMRKDQVAGVQKALERKIALSNVAASALLSCNATEPMDYATAAKSTSDLAALLPKIAQDSKVLSNTMPEKQKKAFLDDVLAMFDAMKEVIDAAQNNRSNLNGVAVEYGNKSGALLYSVCTDFDPSHKKEVISRAKAIGECVSELTEGSSALMSSAEVTDLLCARGKACVIAAGNLVYTAKLVAPSVQIPECREILMDTSAALSDQVRAYSDSWQPLSADPKHKADIEELNAKTVKVEGLLEEFKKDLDSGKLVKMRPSELLVVEDTPLRKLTAVLVDSAIKKSTIASLSAEQRRAYVEYGRQLTAASERLDRANALCKKEPHNVEKSRELENSVQNLQVLALQSRPSLSNHQQQYIVDLTEYVRELSQEADKMASTVASCSTKHKDIDKSCQEITDEAERIMHPSNHRARGDDTTVDDIHEVDKFGRATNSRVKKIASQIEELPDSKDKISLNTQSVNLEDSCNILRFASQSAISTAQSASLDDTLGSLADLESKLDDLLGAGEKHGRRGNEPIPWPVRSSLLQATRSISSQPHLCSALMQYIQEQRIRTDLSDPDAKKRLQEHLRKLTYLLRILTVETSRRVATWQELDGPEVATVMEQVIKEIDSGCSLNQPKKDQSSVLQNIDMNRLLLSSDVIKIEGDRNHVEAKLQQTASKLSSMLATVVSSSSKPASLARSLSVTADAASELSAVARALKIPDDPVYNAKIEEAVRDVTFQTYSVLKASEVVSQEPNNPAYRRRLLDACRALNDALNNLGRTTASDRSTQRVCSELTRSLQFTQTALQSAQPTCALPYTECVDALATQMEVIQKLSSDQPMSQQQFSLALGYVSSAASNSAELASHCAYLMSLDESDQEAAKIGVVDVRHLKKVIEAAQATCYRVLQFDAEQAKEEAVHLISQTQAIREVLLDAQKKSLHLKGEIGAAIRDLQDRANDLEETLKLSDKAKISAATANLLDSIQTVSALSDHPALVPASGDLAGDRKLRQDHVITAARELTNKTVSLVRDVKNYQDHHTDDDEPMTWVTFNLRRKDVLKAFEDLLASIRENGQRAGILEVEHKEEEPPKSYIQIQVELANKWLKRPNCKPEVKVSGEEAARKVIDVAEKMSADMKESEKEDMCVLIAETKDLLSECSNKPTPDKASQLVEKLKSLRKAIERGVITMVVENFIDGEEPLQDLEVLVDSETDARKRKSILERKLAELRAQLDRRTRTVRALRTAARAHAAATELDSCTEQANLLAPLLVKAAQERIDSSDNQAAIENYNSLLAQYAESLSKIQELCDQSVDPMEFVQTAGETMQRMREESSHDNDPQKCVYTSSAITKLANRVIQVSMSSSNAKQDPELRKALSEAQQKLLAAVPGPQTRRSKLPDWKDTTAEILRTTGEVEAVMGGEMIFQNQPTQSDQPIFAAARDLHSVVREWSARDNEIVAVAKRTAVLMARLSAHMNNNAAHEVLVTSQSLVSSAREVAELARKLAMECDDVRIKTNLLQVCDRIPTISGQLKMLTTVKGSSLNSGNKEDQESLNMLVDNAQNLMLSIQQVVRVSAGASVKLAAQRGRVRVRWVRKTYY